MTTRRSFLKSTSLVTAGLFLAPADLNRKKDLIGLQLYTVRDAMAKDPAGTIARGAQTGYTHLEGAT